MEYSPRGLNIDDLSISDNSVFDWGSLPGSSGNRQVGAPSAEGRPAAVDGGTTPSRYDPTGLKRITDITDLVDDSSGDDSDDDIVGSDIENGRNRNKRLSIAGSASSALWCRQVIILVGLAGIIVAASVAIGYAVLNAELMNQAPYSVADGSTGGNADVPQQQMLEIAERVVTACSENKLDEDMTQCQHLCSKNMCCFESGEYSCENDESKDCAVYAGCEALVLGVPMEAAEENEN